MKDIVQLQLSAAKRTYSGFTHLWADMDYHWIDVLGPEEQGAWGPMRRVVERRVVAVGPYWRSK